MTTQTSTQLEDSLRNGVRSITEDEIKKYNEDGYLVLRNMISPEAAAVLKEEIMDIMSIIGLGSSKLRQTAQYLHDSLLAAFVQGRLYKEAASSLMQSPAHLYLPFTAVKGGGGGGEFHFHQDGNYTPYVKGKGINLWTALVPMRDNNGGLRIVPSSHKSGPVASENAGDGDVHRKVSQYPTESVLIEMEPGDCVAFDRWTIHGSGPNHTSEHRVAYAIQFHSEDAVGVYDNAEHLLVKEPRYKDIWGVDTIKPDAAGSREGH